MRTHSKPSSLTVKEGFRHVTTHSTEEFTVCGDCMEAVRQTHSIYIAIIPELHEALTCDLCPAVNDTFALAEQMHMEAEAHFQILAVRHAIKLLDETQHNQHGG
jgi:hypothetical protein